MSNLLLASLVAFLLGGALLSVVATVSLLRDWRRGAGASSPGPVRIVNAGHDFTRAMGDLSKAARERGQR